MRLGIKEVGGQKFVSHVTLFGQAETNNLQNVIREVERIGRKYTLVPLKLGVKRGKFQKVDANWLYLDVHPSPDLEQLRYELAQNLFRLERIIYNTCKSHDHKSKYIFHSSIGKYDPRDKDKFEKLSDYAETKCSLETFRQCKASVFGKLLNIIRNHIFRVEEDDLGINQHLLRITILGKNNHIVCEYDLILKRLLSRREALSRYWWGKTIDRLKELRGSP
ncbi:2'-5' RNA ligase family protein [Chloroflexota bacterium]